ncbi:MAG: hypothetical protein ACRD2T_04115 [Thermoanaerobaculia bacterium]
MPSTARLAIALPLALALAAGPAAAQGFGPQYRGIGFGKNKIQYREFDWQIYHSPHFNVHFYGDTEPLLQKVVSFAESAYDQLSREFDHQIQDPIPLIFYATHSAFEQNNIILNFIPEGLGAFATAARFRMVLPVDLPDPELMELVLHELTHIFQYHMLFQGNLTKAVATSPPVWTMEGMASYMAKDEQQRDKMFLRDAVVNDRIPSVTQNFQGFFAYRFGHAIFDFMEERWGKEGFLDFIYELRNTIGSRVDRAIERAFKMDAEEFDAEFRRWLRRKYLPQLVETGEPADFGRLFRVEREGTSQEISPSASPSGDLVAAFSSYKADVDVVLFDTRKRRLLRNLTTGYSNEYQYLVAQELELGRKMGRDLDFAPDGNTIAVFAKREKGRDLLLIDVLHGGIERSFRSEGIEQQTAPAWSPDGKKIAFGGFKGGQFDLFLLDLESGQVANVTNDAVFDGAPDFSPDGRSLVFVSVVGTGYAKLFRVDLADPGRRFQLTSGDSNENDPVYSPDGQRIYFTSDRKGAENIFSLDLQSGELKQWTDVVTGAFMPTVLREGEDQERLVYTGYWKGRFDLYVRETDKPVEDPTTVEVAVTPVTPQDLPVFEPDIQVAIDEGNKDDYKGFKFFLEDAESYVGVEDDQTVVGRVFLTFSDYLGDRRILAALDSIDSFSNFDILYLDLSRRLQWQLHLFDDRTFFNLQDPVTRPTRGRTLFKQTGAIGSILYPFTFYTRAELGVGYLFREVTVPFVAFDPGTGESSLEFAEISDDFPLAQAALVGDSALFAPWGPIGGRRWRLDLFYAPDFDQGGALTSSADIDFRQYFPVTQRSNFALRGFVGASEGNRQNLLYFGGLDTVRGVRFRGLVGDTGFFANAEFRFPLIDVLATPLLNFQQIRGVVFLDVGGAWFRELETFDFLDDDETRLQDGVSSYGFGVTLRLFGLDLNWDFAKRWDFAESDQGFATSFWIGNRF